MQFPAPMEVHGSNKVEIPINPINTNGFKDIKCHVALVRDLTISFERSLKEGTSSGGEGEAEGLLIFKEIEYQSSTKKLVVDVSPGAKARYFVGICASGIPSNPDSEQVRIYSSWRVYNDGSGIPVQVATTHDNTLEKFYSRAFMVSDSEVVYMLQCGLSTPSACSLSVTCGSETRSVSTANFAGFIQATDIKNAFSIAKTDSHFQNLVIKDGSRFNIFMIFRKDGASNIELKCKQTTATGSKLLADSVKTSIVTDCICFEQRGIGRRRS